MTKTLEICKDCYRKRPLKRDALDFLFKKTKTRIDLLKKPFIYITLGADQLLDVVDLMEVCHFEDIEKIYSYEKTHKKATEAENCLVAKIFNKWHHNIKYRDKVKILEKVFPQDLPTLISNEISKIIFFDDTGWFSENDAKMLCHLLKKDIINHNDILIITSSLDNIGWSGKSKVKSKAIEQYNRYFLWGKKIEEKTVKDNIVDLYIDHALNLYNLFDKKVNGSKKQLTANLISKVKYQDRDHSTMGLWAYYFIEGAKRLQLPNDFDTTYIDGRISNMFDGMSKKDDVAS